MYIDIDNFSIFRLGQGVGFFTDVKLLCRNAGKICESTCSKSSS
jgi:hypothetical protein